jgi:alpha-D-xyloside xylohydrolase
MGPFIQYAGEKTDGTIELRVYTGANGSFTLYEDENDNFDYEKGISSKIPFLWNEKTKTLTVGARKGGYPGMIKDRKIQVVFVREFHGAGLEIEKNVDREILYHGKAVQLKEPKAGKERVEEKKPGKR